MTNLIKQIIDDLLKPFLADFKEMPLWIKWGAVVMTSIAFMILAFVFRARSEGVYNDKPRIHFIQNMDNQPKFVSQEANAMFNDGRGMRPKVEGTVARNEMTGDTHFFMGIVDEAWATTFPDQITVDRPLLDRGQGRFNIFCSPCHGAGGFGDGVIHHRAQRLVETGVNGTTWVAPKNLHEDMIAAQPVGQIFNTITNGIRTMAAHGSQIPVADRWAIVAYIEALQLSQNADASTVPNADSLPRVDEGSNK
ncbi:MAG: cytochrome c [Planctomycetes bacterium]|nr:cytochrome c [Planctomycetota bacterium]